MAEHQFQSIFDYIDKKIDEVLEKMATKDDIHDLRNSVDTFAKQSKDLHDEVTILTMKVHRTEAWIKQASDKIGIPYNQ